MKTEISFASKMENINIIEKIVDELSAQYNFGTEIYGNILVASVEAVNNAIIHGNKIDESKSVHIKIEINNNKQKKAYPNYIIKDKILKFYDYLFFHLMELFDIYLNILIFIFSGFFFLMLESF